MDTPSECPFCGNHEVAADISEFPSRSAVICPQCGARGPTAEREAGECESSLIPQAITEWNNRN